jgi:hypothetical protein
MKANVNSEFEGSYRRDVHETLIRNALTEEGVEFPGSSDSDEIEDANDKANDTMASVNTLINKYLNDMTTETQKLNDIKGDLSGIYQKAIKCHDLKEAWRKKAAEGSSSLAKEDMKEIDGLGGNVTINPWINLVEKMYNGELSPSKLYNLNDAISGALQDVKDKIDAMTYGTKHVKNGRWVVSGSKKLKNLSSLSVSTTFISLTYYEDDLKVGDMTEADFDAAIDDQNGTFYFAGADIPSGDARYRRDSLVYSNDPLYQELASMDGKGVFTYKNESGADYKQVQKDMENKKKKEDDSSGDAKKAIDGGGKKDALKVNIVSSSVGIEGDFPSAISKESMSLFDSFVGLITNFANKGFEDGLLNMRDALYSAEYAKGMFSYYTIEEEETKYRDRIPEEEQMKSLTLTPMDAEHNLAMYSELEYILYGQGGSADIFEAGKDIYAVRLMLNIPSAFLTFYTTIEDFEHKPTASTLLVLAKSAQAATAGIIPYPVFQIVFILAMAAVETGIDLSKLLAGHAVDLFKGNKEEKWTFSLKGGLSDLKDWADAMPESGEENGSAKESNLMDTDGDGTKDVCLFYSDYIYLFLLIGYNNSGQADKMYKRTADVIQANIMHQGGGDFRMANANVYYRLAADMKVSPLMLALPIADEYTPDNIGDWRYWQFKEDMVRGYQ